MRRVGGIFAAAFAMAIGGGSAAVPSDDPATRVRAAITAVDHATQASQGFALDSRTGVPRLAAQWDAARQLAIGLLDRNPAIGETALQKALQRSGLAQALAIRLDAGAMLVGVEAGAFGTFTLLTQGPDGHFRTALALDTPPAGLPAYLAAWRPDRSMANCGSGPNQDRGTTCGPMTIADARLLTPEAGGARRFALLGRYVKEAGATDAYQLSIWRWDGQKAAPLLTRTLTQVADEAILVAGGTRELRLHAKGDFKSVMGCGGCSGRQMEWRFALPAKGVAPPVVRSLTPDLDAVDAVYDRLLHGHAADGLAAPAVIASLTPVAQSVRDKARIDRIDPALGLLGSWKLTRVSGGAVDLCFSADDVDPQVFRIENRGGRRYVAAVRAAGQHACEGPDAHS